MALRPERGRQSAVEGHDVLDTPALAGGEVNGIPCGLIGVTCLEDGPELVGGGDLPSRPSRSRRCSAASLNQPPSD